MILTQWLQNLHRNWFQEVKENAAYRDNDIAILERFIGVYCRKHHGRSRKEPLCPECQELFEYAIERRKHCPYDPKPACKNCPTHCYRPAYRQQIREIMKFSGMYYVKRGRIDWLLRYFLNNNKLNE